MEGGVLVFEELIISLFYLLYENQILAFLDVVKSHFFP